MAIFLQLKITSDPKDISARFYGTLYTLAKAGIHGLYHVPTINSDAFIVIFNPDLRLTTESIETLNLMIEKEVKHVVVTTIENCHISIEHLKPYGAFLVKYLKAIESTDEVIMDIIGDTLKSIPSILQKPVYTDKGNLIAKKGPISDYFGGGNSLLEPNQIQYGVYEDKLSQRKYLQIEKNLFAAFMLVDDTINKRIRHRSFWSAFYRSDKKLLTATNSLKITQENHPSILLDMKVAGTGYDMLTPENNRADYYANVNLFYNTLLTVLPFKPNTERMYDPNTLSTASVKLVGVTITPKSIFNFMIDVQRALLASGLMNEFLINILYLQEQEMVIKTKTDILAKLNITDLSPSAVNKGLRTAAANNLSEEIYLLLSFEEVDINAQDSNPASQRTALHLAVEKEKLAAIAALVLHGAKTDIPDAKGMTVNSIAANSNNPNILRILGHEPNAELEASSSAPRMS